ncbi:hypothetical protein Goshw_030341 [Gossypium schwendimanii]|uniref:Uncharacterized protein n=1 Tax=Gossypium schwendimanii TaxID=34291 RepID=A0A7J9L6V4_GOSSC|nr:hypothetical protein [Gossypium schwendimanii]
MQVNKFLLLHLLILARYWQKHTDCWPSNKKEHCLRSANSTKLRNGHSRKCSKIISNIM